MNRKNLNKANCCQPDLCKQASMPKSSHKNVDSTFSKQDKKKLRPPDKKNIDSHLSQIKFKEKELKNCYTETRSIRQEMKTLQPNRYILIEEKKKNNLELKTLREEIFVKNNNLSRLQSVLTYKNEHKINEAIKKLELQLSCNTFKLREKRKIIAEIDSLKGSKKFLVNYLAQKKEIDELREQQLKKRRENEQYHRQVSMLISKEDEMRFRLHILQTTIDSLHSELNGLTEQKKFLLSDYKRREKDHNVMKDAIRKKNRQNSKHKEEEKPPPIHRNHREDSKVFPTPEEECLQHCNILINYLQQFPVSDIGQTSCQVPSPTEETAAASLGPSTEIQAEHAATYVLLKKNDESEQLFFGAGRRQNKKIKRGRRFSATKPLPHSQEILVQFENLQMSAPSGFAEIPSALKMLEEKKEYFEFLIQQGEEGLNQSSKEEEAAVEQDDVCLSDSGYSADGSAACELSRQVSHTESIEGSSSNINLLEIISLIQAESVRNDQPSWSSSSSSSSSDEDDDILQGIGNGFQKLSNVSNTPIPLAQGQSTDTTQSLRPNELRVSELDRKETTLTTDGQSKATAALLCETLPNKPLSAELGMLNLKFASMISHDSCAEETQSCEELFSKRPAEIMITNCRETNSNSSSCSSSSSSNCNDDLSDRRSKSSRNFLNVVKSKRVRNFSPTTDISCDLKGMQYEALASPSGLRFTNRSGPEPSGACESSSEDEERSVNVETIEEEAEEEDYEVAEPVVEEEEEDEYGEEEEEEEDNDNDEGEMEGRRLEEDLTDNSDSEKDNEKSAMRGYSESGDDNTDDDNDKKLEDEEQAS